jgi:uncharacterized membrane protein
VLFHLAQHLLHKPAHALDDEERRVLDSIDSGTIVSRDAADESDARASLGDRLADKVAAVGGSWGFIIAFSALRLAFTVACMRSAYSFCDSTVGPLPLRRLE